jgi:tryptophan-rich sensory protein
MAGYDRLAKPSGMAVPTKIGPIWMILYPIILISFGFVQVFQGKVSRMVAVPFVINLVAFMTFP